MKNLRYCLLLLGAVLALNLSAQDKADETLNKAIRKHGLEQSQAMDIAGWLTDVHGPRLTGSPQLDRATEWVVATLKSWGMENVHTEEWGPFGRGWELKRFHLDCDAPVPFPVIAYPKAWSPSTKGRITGEVVYLEAGTEEELAPYKGRLKGKFILLDTIRDVTPEFDAQARRYNAEDLLKMANAPMPTPFGFRNWGSGQRFSTRLWEFLYDEQPAAVIDRNFKGELGTVFATGARARKGAARDKDAEVLPQLTMSAEHYNRIFRLVRKGITVKLGMEMTVEYSNPSGMSRNIIAEIPGTDLKDEVVIFGAHIDSWHCGTGATDNAAGSTAMMEAARILLETIKETGVRPRRTLRLALWTGEEQGLLGSRAYVRDHFADLDSMGSVVRYKPAQEKVSAYYNLDNGTGKIRGIYLQGNPAVQSIFRAWLDPFKDLEANTITLSNTGGTDHQSFDRVGIPGFQFIQDPVAYSTRTHHSNMDNLDHLIEDDLKQAATIIASFVMHTAQRKDMLPRKPREEETPARAPSGGR
ncbi:MAG: M20/M25/M40 family metallo-hydrolase [Saprospiraceae bacterium]|nr:M20/M25/M40 family metallo-hydrolase [Saprospiraceae bacterium]